MNLHKSGVLINYDLPWNPTRIMQRVGRINRVGTQFDRIYVFNFFPTAQSDEHLPLKDRITEKLQAFHDTLGEDFKYLSDNEEVTSHKLYDDLTADMDENEIGNPELFYLAEIRNIRDNNTDLFDKIKKLPRKAKSGKYSNYINDNSTITFLRKGYLKLFFKTGSNETNGITFLEAIKLISATPDDKPISIGSVFFDHLNSNKVAFDEKLIEEEVADLDKSRASGNDAKIVKLLKALSNCKKLTGLQEENLKKMIDLWQNGEIPAKITKDVLKIVKKETDELILFTEIYNRVHESYFTDRNYKPDTMIGMKQVILSCWLEKAEV